MGSDNWITGHFRQFLAFFAFVAVLGAAPAGGAMTCDDCIMYAVGYFNECMDDPDLSHATCADRYESMVGICLESVCEEKPE